ncbi:MAG: sulfotransferase domain-containing protein [Bradymonadaceae bacterium]
MKVLQIGAPRSGNFWLWRILQQIIERAGLPNGSVVRSHPIHKVADSLELSHDRQADIDMLDILPSRHVWRVSSVWRMPIADVPSYVDRVDHVWTHSRFCPASPAVFDAFDRIVYICRDPRDRALSSARYAFTPYMLRYFPHGEPDPETWLDHRFADHVRDWMWHVFDHLRYRDRFDIHVLFYERLLHAFDRTLDRLLAYLDVDLPRTEREAIRRAVTFETMRRQNPDHVREGRSERWRRQMSDRRLGRTVEIAGPMLDLLDYARDRRAPPLDERSLPSVPAGLERGAIEQYVPT